MDLCGVRFEIVVPDGLSEEAALQRTTHLGIGAHADDLEFMSLHGILECYEKPDQWFTGITVTNGSGSVRSGVTSGTSDKELVAIRWKEQVEAARIGKYGAILGLPYSSADLRVMDQTQWLDLLEALIKKTRPKILYTHNPADKHDTHVSVVVPLLQRLQRLPKEFHPEKIYGCEGWRGLDWLMDSEKQIFDISARPDLGKALGAVFRSQIDSGKQYDLAVHGRRLMNATFLSPHHTDPAKLVELAMDLTPLLEKPELDPVRFVQDHILRFEKDVMQRMQRYLRDF